MLYDHPPEVKQRQKRESKRSAHKTASPGRLHYSTKLLDMWDSEPRLVAARRSLKTACRNSLVSA